MGSKYRLRENDFVIYILLITYTLNGPDKTYVWRQKERPKCKFESIYCMCGFRGGDPELPPPLEICHKWGLVWMFDG